MALLQPRLNVKVAQRQVLTPSLVQMVSVLALNKVELKEMIDAEMVENPVLEEIDESVPTLDEITSREELLERGAEETVAPPKDVFNEIDFGSYFQEYLDPGYRTQPEYEESEKPSFENFLSQPTTLSDHLAWQLGALNLEPRLEAAAEFVVGNLDGNGYLAASEDELVEALGLALSSAKLNLTAKTNGAAAVNGAGVVEGTAAGNGSSAGHANAGTNGSLPAIGPAAPETIRELLRRAVDLVQHLDPAGVGARDLRECLALQIAAQQEEFVAQYGPSVNLTLAAEAQSNGHGSVEAEARIEERRRSMEVAAHIVDRHLHLLQKRDLKDLAQAARISATEAEAGVAFIRTLDPRPGRMYNLEETRLIEPDVFFVKRGDEWTVSMNEEDLPSLRLSQRYRRMLVAHNTDKEVKEYVKERFRSALQLMRHIAQRKSTILRTCEIIVRRQQEFLEKGVEALRPMMIKEVAEEIGVHPSTVSRAVANKYAHTPQGVVELRFFFSEGTNGPEGADTPLLVLKRKVRKLIEDEDAKHPLTDDQIADMLQQQGIRLTRRTVAKYREDMKIPSTHQRRKRD
ncbi:MAG TPA: RNA polymerase sigma-54 factor [Terracidiphilus sp.]|nr:RNA polymerase sigma-54 factor [Terracidiphilus sp.]